MGLAGLKHARQRLRDAEHPWLNTLVMFDFASFRQVRYMRETELEKVLDLEPQTLKSAGMPLEGMKLVLNEDVDAINEDATHVLTLNERLTRYALYVSQLERSNKELGAQVETMMAALAAEKQAQKDAQLSFDEERGELLGKVAAAEAQTAVALQKVDEALDKGGASQKDLERANEAKRLADARVKTMEGACDELRQICEIGRAHV